MQETEIGLGFSAQAVPVVPRGFQHGEGADDIGLHEIARPGYRAIDVALGGQMHDMIGPEAGNGFDHGGAVADIGPDERIGVAAFDRRQAFEIAGIGQLVEI